MQVGISLSSVLDGETLRVTRVQLSGSKHTLGARKHVLSRVARARHGGTSALRITLAAREI